MKWFNDSLCYKEDLLGDTSQRRSHRHNEHNDAKEYVHLFVSSLETVSHSRQEEDAESENPLKYRISLLSEDEFHTDYCQTSNKSHISVANKTVDHSDVVGAPPISAAPTTSLFTI